MNSYEQIKKNACLAELNRVIPDVSGQMVCAKVSKENVQSQHMKCVI